MVLLSKHGLFSPRLPIELERRILQYDNTYLEYFRKAVLPELMEHSWKRLTCLFFTAFQLTEFYTMLSDFEEEEDEDEEDEEEFD